MKLESNKFVVRLCTLLCLLFIFLCEGCKKLIDVDPPITSLTGKTVFATDATSISYITGIYAQLASASIANGGITSSSLYLGLSSDELELYSGSTNTVLRSYYKNALNSSATGGADFWQSLYPIIYVCNSSIFGITNSNTLNPQVKKQLLGEALFMRSLCYFYLVNLYGDIPLILSTDYTVNSTVSRSPKSLIWKQIISDLIEAKDKLSNTYLDGTLLGSSIDRVRPTKWAASALLSRCYLFTADFVNAETEANTVINESSLFSITTLTDVFLNTSQEAIFQFQPVNAGWNTEEARLFILSSKGPTNTRPVFLSSNLIDAFEQGDLRKDYWTKSVTKSGIIYVFPYKYQSATLNDPVVEYSTILRLSEQYLIRAEARAQLGNSSDISGAVSDLNIIRRRAGLADYSDLLNKKNVINAIIHERQVELFCELGQRWLDLKRTGQIDDVMSIVTQMKGGSWDTRWQYYPIPLAELQKSPNIQQNLGYE